MENKHGEPCDISGHRDIDALRKMTRRAKDEIEAKIIEEINDINTDLWIEGRKELTTLEAALVIWRVARIEGIKAGTESIKSEIEFRKRHGLGEDEPLPPPRKRMEMDQNKI